MVFSFFGILFFLIPSIAAAANCCVYYYKNKAETCAVMQVPGYSLQEYAGAGNKLYKQFSCSAYTKASATGGECANGSITLDGISECLGSDHVLYKTTLAGAQVIPDAQGKNCLPIEDYTSEIVSGTAPLCSVGTYLVDHPIDKSIPFLVDYNAALKKNFGSFDKSMLQQKLQEYAQNSCCVPTVPKSGLCSAPHLSLKVQKVLSPLPPALSDIESTKELLGQIAAAVNSGNIDQLKNIVACADDDTNTGFAYYNLKCSSNVTVDAPSDNYKGFDAEFNHTLVGYCGENKNTVTDSENKKNTLNNFIIPSTKDLNQIGTVDPENLIARFIKGLLGILGSISLVMFVYSGILYMTAAGNSERTEKAKHILVWNSLGLAIIFSSYAILKIVFEAFS